MPKKKQSEAPEAQSERFRAAVRTAIAAGELNPTEAEETMERMLRSGSVKARSA